MVFCLGVVVYINVFNFFGWGMGEKLVVSMLVGMFVVIKFVTSMVFLVVCMVEIMVESGLMFDGMLLFIVGLCGDLVDYMGVQDVLVFIGLVDIGNMLCSKINIIEGFVFVNVEVDSLNSVVLGLDVDVEIDTYDLFLCEVVKDMI